MIMMMISLCPDSDLYQVVILKSESAVGLFVSFLSVAGFMRQRIQKYQSYFADMT